jgi:4-hydroxybenzoate polyprenyltransferase
MTFIINSIKLIRPLNAIIVFATLMVVRYILTASFDKFGLEPGIHFWDYLLMIIIGMWILGSGNVINDIIDQEIDKINKPGKVIIPHKISNNQALFIYWSMNASAIICSAYLAFKYQVNNYLLVPFLTIALLYIYSKWLKKSLFFGNYVIAFLCAVLPVVGFLVEKRNLDIIKLQNYDTYILIIYQIICMVTFSFLLVLCRELVKDCEDVEGDASAGARTIPIKFGIQFSRKLMLWYIFSYLIVFAITNYLRFELTSSYNLIIWTFIYIVLVVISFLFIKNKYRELIFFKKMSSMIKIYMIMGLLFMLIN